MKIMETRFYCDDCGKPLPKSFVRGEGEKAEFALGEYNTVRKPYSIQGIPAEVHVGLRVDIPCGPTYTELCPECRLKWLKAALTDFERQAEQYAKEQEDD